jgi:Flp pilus assembly protein TadG
MRNPSRHRGSEQGATAVETALIISTLLLLIFGAIEFGRAFWTYNSMVLAVEEAGRYAMVFNQGPPTTCGAQTQAASCPTLSSTPLANCAAAQAQSILSSYAAPSAVGVSVSQNNAATPPTMTICGSYTLDFVVPTLLPYGPIGLTTQVTVPLI